MRDRRLILTEAVQIKVRKQDISEKIECSIRQEERERRGKKKRNLEEWLDGRWRRRKNKKTVKAENEEEVGRRRAASRE